MKLSEILSTQDKEFIVLPHKASNTEEHLINSLIFTEDSVLCFHWKLQNRVLVCNLFTDDVVFKTVNYIN